MQRLSLLELNAISCNRECHPGSHYWDLYPGVLSQVKSLQLIWRWGTPRFHLRVPYLLMSGRDLTAWQGTWVVCSLCLSVILHNGVLLPGRQYAHSFLFIIPYAQLSCWGIYWFHYIHPSVCPSVWFDPFHIYTSYQATSEDVSHGKFLANFKILIFGNSLKFVTFDFVLFSLGIWCESLVWVIMWRRGYLRT